MKASPKPVNTYKLPDAGTVLVWLDSLVDMGTHTTTFKDQTKEQRKIRLTWEIIGTETSSEDKRPLTISQLYTWDMGEKSNLYKLIKPWLGKNPDRSMDLEELFKIPGMASIVHSQSGEKTYANVSGILPVMKGTKVPDRVNKPMVFDMDDSRTSVMDFLALPDYMKKKIMESPEGKARFGVEGNGTPDLSHNDEDVPF